VQVVGVQKRKLGGRWMRWLAYVVEVDSHGSWLFTPQGSIVVGGRSEITASSYVGVPEAPGVAVLHLAPRGDWWFAAWANDTVGRRLSIDLSRPPVFADGVWTFEDLELDLWNRGHDVGVADRDEFDDACAAGSITPVEREACLAASERLADAVRAGSSPFGERAWQLLAELDQSDLPPLTTPT
jgi:hypothetical protein